VTRWLLALCLATACREAPTLVADAAPRPTPRATGDDLQPDATPEPEVAPQPLDVLSGQQAEQAIAGDVATPAPPPASELAWEITPTGIGRVRLGASRAELLQTFADTPRPRQRWVKLSQPGARAGPMAPPGLETAEILDARGIRMFRFRLLGGRVALAATGYADPQIATEAGLAIGTTLDAAILAHGDPRPVSLSVAGERVTGVILEDLPGVVVQAAPNGSIYGLVVVGPESD
jgi:hypothetical protein